MQTVRVRTTQNVFIDYPIASIGDRILAYLLDRFILLVYSIAVFAVMIEFDVQLWYVWLILLGFPWLFYNLAFEIFMNGQSPGKRVLKIQVVRLDGTPPTIGDYLLRWIFAFIDLYFLSGAIAVTIIALGGKGQRLGDIVAGTSVVKLLEQREITASEVFITPDEDHVATFTQVVQLGSREIELIQRALDAYRQQGNDQPMNLLTEKIKTMLGITTDMSPEEFLNTVVKDYSKLTAAGL